jgi:predicted nucleotide-binding protein
MAIYMARRSEPLHQPERPALTVEQKRRCIVRLNKRIEELEAFDPETVEKRFPPEVTALENAIDEALSAAFGYGTVEYNRYSAAARLDHGPQFTNAMVQSVRQGPHVGNALSAQEARRFLADGKKRSVILLRQATRAIEEEVSEQEQPVVPSPAQFTSKVFVVHGHGGGEHAVAGFLRKLGLEPVILHEKANEGRTIIEKFEAHSDVGFAVVLITPDDIGGLKDGPQRPRARQNVILELGYFVGRLGRKKVCPLIESDVELPSDVLGVAWVGLDKHEGWHMKLAKELQAAGYEFDLNKAISE